MPLIVLTGLTGAGKTDLLCALAAAGEHTIDLEALAVHSGSAYGGIGRPPQPSPAEFTAAVARAAAGAGQDHITWIEDEGAFLGSLTVPVWLRGSIAAAPTVEVVAPTRVRIARLVAGYGRLDPAELVRATRRIGPRLGRLPANRAIRCFSSGDPAGAIEVLLPYFDEAYAHRIATLSRRRLAVVETNRLLDLAAPGVVQSCVAPFAPRNPQWTAVWGGHVLLPSG